MWCYHGAKTNFVRHYPRPLHGKIFEPFAGTARYSLMYFDRDVVLVDRYKELIDIWKWLQICSPGDVLRIPKKVIVGQTVDDFTFECQEARDLFRFLLGKGSHSPRNTVTEWCVSRPNFINYSLNRIAANLFKIKHWDIRYGDYQDLQDQKATWFIDAPYIKQGGSYKYGSNSIDFEQLRRYCLSRSGQVIVCEGTGASWLPFQPFRNINSTTRGIPYTEQIYYQVNQQGVEFHPTQLPLF